MNSEIVKLHIKLDNYLYLPIKQVYEEIKNALLHQILVFIIHKKYKNHTQQQQM